METATATATATETPTTSVTENRLRRLTAADLDSANAVIEAAVLSWQLPARVKRLSVPLLCYDRNDLAHLTLVGALDATGAILGVAAWEAAGSTDAPGGARGLLLHGIYVHPAWQRTGIGKRLLAAAVAAARRDGFDGLLVKANPEALGFFAAQGLEALADGDAERAYPYRFWLDLGAS